MVIPQQQRIPVAVAVASPVPTPAAPTKEAFDELRREVERLRKQVSQLSHRLDELHPPCHLTGL